MDHGMDMDSVSNPSGPTAYNTKYTLRAGVFHNMEYLYGTEAYFYK